MNIKIPYSYYEEHKKDKGVVMKKINLLRDFIIENFDLLERSSSWGTSLKYPEFDLLPRDFLKFAKDELYNSQLKDEKLIHIINCVSHLKRALDCQLDIFLYQLNLYELAKRKNFGFDKKLEFVKNVGVIESSSISRLNNIRNKMEHHYKVPEITEIEVYFDLVNAFISAIESALILFLFNCEIQVESTNKDTFKWFDLHYVFDKNPKITFKISYANPSEATSVEVESTEQITFAYYLRVLIHLAKLDFMKKDYILEELKYKTDQ